MEDQYKLDSTYKFANAIVRVHRPILTEEERERRMEKLKQATADFMLSICCERERQQEKEASA